MGNCGSFPKTKGDEAVPAPEPLKGDSIKVDNNNSNDQESVTKVEEEEKTITTDDNFIAEKKNSDNLDLHDGDEAKPALDDDKTAQSPKDSLVENGGKEEKGDEESEKKVEVEVASEAKEEAKEEKEVEAVKGEKVDQEKTNKAEPEKAFEPAAPVADIPVATIQ